MKDLPKRTSKHSPIEISSKKPVGRFRQIVDPLRKVLFQTHIQDIRDPRFDPLSGSFHPHLFHRSYGTHIQDLQHSEIDSLKSKSAKTKDPLEKAQLDALVQSMVCVSCSRIVLAHRDSKSPRTAPNNQARLEKTGNSAGQRRKETFSSQRGYVFQYSSPSRFKETRIDQKV